MSGTSIKQPANTADSMNNIRSDTLLKAAVTIIVAGAWVWNTLPAVLHFWWTTICIFGVCLTEAVASSGFFVLRCHIYISSYVLTGLVCDLHMMDDR